MRLREFGGRANAWAQFAPGPVVKAVLRVQRYAASLSEWRSAADDRPLCQCLGRARNAPLGLDVCGRLLAAPEPFRLRGRRPGFLCHSCLTTSTPRKSRQPEATKKGVRFAVKGEIVAKNAVLFGV